MKTRGRHRVRTRGTHLDGGSSVCRARPCRHFHASVADAVCLAIGPCLFQGFKLLLRYGRYEMATCPARTSGTSRQTGSPRNPPPVSSHTDSRSPRARPRQQRPIGNDLKIADSLGLMRQRGQQRWQAAREARGHTTPVIQTTLISYSSPASQRAIALCYLQNPTHTLVCCSSAVS